MASKNVGGDTTLPKDAPVVDTPATDPTPATPATPDAPVTDAPATTDVPAAGGDTVDTSEGAGTVEQDKSGSEGWTAQQDGAFVTEEEIPGQVFVEAQLPDPEVQKAYGIDVDQYVAGLTVLDPAEAAKHPSGPEPSDVVYTTHLIEEEPRQPDRLQEPDGTPRVPDGLPEAAPADSETATETTPEVTDPAPADAPADVPADSTKATV